MEEKPDWRSESYAKAFEAHDRADFAPEFLRLFCAVNSASCA